MSLQVQCPSPECQAAFERPLSDSGKIISCPHCNTPVILPVSMQGGVAGQLLGSYKLIRLIARGGMGEVFEATQLNLDRRVALKVVGHELTVNETFLQRFEREAKSAAAINHPNLVQVYDFGQVDGRAFLAMEFIDGEDLSRRIGRDGKLEIPEALRIIEASASALAEAHARGIVHRDIKPGNILLTSKGQVKVSDLGLARKLDDDLDLTATGVGIGSPHFMAPEQASDARHVDHRADIYSLGITLLYLLTGKRPFDGPSIYGLVLAHANNPLPRGAELGTELPDDVERLIRRMTAKRPENRYPDCAALIGDIRRVRSGQPLEGASPTDETIGSAADFQSQSSAGAPDDSWAPSPQPRLEPARSSKKMWLTVSAVAVAAVAVLAVIVVPKFFKKENLASSGNGTSANTQPGDRGQFSDDGNRRPPPREDFEPPEGQKGGRGFGPPNPLLPLTEIVNPLAEGPVAAQWAQAQAYAKANPTNYRSALARYAQVLSKAKGLPLEKQVTQAIADLTKRRDEAFEKMFTAQKQRMEEALARGEGPRSLAGLRGFPDELRSEEKDRIIYEFVLKNGPRIGPPPRRDGEGPEPDRGGKGPPPGQGPPKNP